MATQNDIAILFDELRWHGALSPRHLPSTRPGLRRARPVERRASRRQPTSGEGTLCWTDSSGERGTCTVQATDMSDGGMQLQTSTPVPIPSVARLFGRTLECVGYIRYCRKEGGKFSLGIEIAGEPYPCRSDWKS